MTIKNPIEWSGARFVDAAHFFQAAGHSIHHIQDTIHAPEPAVRRIRVVDLWDVLRKGIDDFAAYRSDVLFLCTIYPVIGLILARFAGGLDMIPLLFPLASGFGNSHRLRSGRSTDSGAPLAHHNLASLNTV